MPTEPIRVLIAEDSLTIRYHLAAMLDDAPGFAVAGTARTGAEALELVRELTPDVVSMDVKMPTMDGLAATRHIMRTTPTPVVVVSGLLEREIDLSFRALQAGALAVLPKPPARTAPNFATEQQRLLNTLRAMAGVKLVRRWATVYETIESGEAAGYQTGKLRPAPVLVAVAASAGGPSVLATLVGGLQNRLAVPMVVVQHMPGEFLGGLSRWLMRFTSLPVSIVGHGEVLAAGTIYLAPSHAHLRVYGRGGAFVTELDAERGGYHHHPAADVLFESVARACGARGVGVVLSGMGTDGARGLLMIRQQGGRTFAQDERSSTVYGMPGAAVRLGAAEQIMSPMQMATALQKLMFGTDSMNLLE